MQKFYGKLAGYGKAIPRRVVTNQELSARIDTTDEWITERTGIKQRHVVSEDEHCSTLATQAAREALTKANVDGADLDLIIVATSSPDYLTPPVSSQVQHELGATKAGAFVMVVGCTGFVSALITADQFIRTGAYKNILVVGVEVITRMVNWEDRNTCVLFGDGAAAVVLKAVEYETGIKSHLMGSDGSGWEHILHPSGGTKNPPTHETLDAGQQYLTMNGREVFKFATSTIGKALHKVLSDANLSIEDIDLFIPHQANARIIEYAAKSVNLPDEKVFVNVNNYGNTSAASVPIAITEAFETGRLKEGDTLALVAFGSGLTWAACVLTV
jgi:3-oxoacyl-[acyl-carrier-protein] synthase-3